MKILLAAQGAAATRLCAATINRLALTAGDEVIITSSVAPPVVLGAWGYGAGAVSPMLLDDARKAARDVARRAIQEASHELRAAPCLVRQVVRVGHQVDVVPAVARDIGAQTLVVAADDVIPSGALGRLLDSIDASVLVARSPAVPLRRVMLAFDGSAESRAAARFLGEFPLPTGAHIDVLVCGDGHRSMDHLSRAFDLLGRERIDPELVAADGVAAVTTSGRRATPVIRYGSPYREIVNAAEERSIQLVVTGARAVGALHRIFAGSVSRAVSQDAPCSVLVAGRDRGSALRAAS